LIFGHILPQWTIDKGQRTNDNRLPQSGHWVCIKRRIIANNWDLLHQCLRDEQPVERITMMKGQRYQRHCVLRLNSQDAKAIVDNTPLYECRIRLIEGVFFQTDLDGNFPLTRWAHQLRVCAVENVGFCCVAQLHLA
jgi:hypothetical protein